MPNTAPAADGDAPELKAGHPPAVKVGGMRITQRTHSTSSTHSDKGAEENEDGSVPSACSFAPKTVVNKATGGVPDTVVPSVPESVKQFHEKPQPTHDNRSHSGKPNVIQQPKK